MFLVISEFPHLMICTGSKVGIKFKAENAYQYEVGQELKFNDIRFNVTGFLNKIGSNQLETERIRDYGSRKHKRTQHMESKQDLFSIRK
jgi:hypothetical protein